ncbi:MAG TPA: hypothetical protein PLQ35_18025 [bacterium]|nr:hypothetical protein [bacterium]HQL64176.1 hypothetical protein [bacterium]
MRRKIQANRNGSDRSYSNDPLYELRLSVKRAGEWQLEIWQLPSPATPRLKSPEPVAALKGTPLRMIENRVIKRLSRVKINLGAMTAGKKKTWPLEEELALTLGLLFRALAPMRNLDRIRQVADGIESMSREEAAYWLGMAMHRKYPRRVLAALRTLLTMP